MKYLKFVYSDVYKRRQTQSTWLRLGNNMHIVVISIRKLKNMHCLFFTEMHSLITSTLLLPTVTHHMKTCTHLSSLMLVLMSHIPAQCLAYQAHIYNTHSTHIQHTLFNLHIHVISTNNKIILDGGGGQLGGRWKTLHINSKDQKKLNKVLRLNVRKIQLNVNQGIFNPCKSKGGVIMTPLLLEKISATLLLAI